MTGFYLGPVGFLQALADPAPGFDPSPSVTIAQRRLLSGQVVAQRIGQPKRTYALSWPGMSSDEFAVLEGLYYGAYGPGPYALIDPLRTNLLTANQSSGTETLADTTGWENATGIGSMTSQRSANASIGSIQGVRWLDYTVTTALTAVYQQVIRCTVNSAYLVPVVPGQTYTASAQLFGGGSGPWPTQQLSLRFYDYQLNEIAGSEALTSRTISAAWLPVAATGTAPSTAWYAGLEVANASTTTSGYEVLMDAFQLEQASAASPWVLGTGVPKVSFTDLRVKQIPGGYWDAAATLVEVG